MKLIDLLVKIANNEEIPNKFKFAQQTFTRNGTSYEDEDGDDIFESIFNDFSNINDEIEIIEEDKPTEKISEIKKMLDIAFSNLEDALDKINLLENELEKEKE